MKKTTNTGFTLVELIIVITILAILATIAFISFQGYTRDSRNAKRDSDTNTIVRSLEVKGAEGVSTLDFVSNTGNQLATVALGGYAAAAVGTDEYKAGDVNYTVLGANDASFKDPKSGDAYVVGATVRAGGVYQVAATKENEAGAQAMVKGTYKKRDNATSFSGEITGEKIKLTNAGLGMFKKMDVILLDGTETGVVLAVSADLATLTLKADPSASGSQNIKLLTSESDGLVGTGSASTEAVVNDGTSYLPY